MESWQLRPEKSYQSKLYLWAFIAAFFAIGSSALMGWLIGNDAVGPEGARNGVLIGIGINLIWLLPLLIWIAPYRRSLRYEIEDDEVIVRGGVLTKSVKHVPYRTVTNIEITRGLIDRALGLGSLKIQTAGMSGSTGAEENLVGLANVEEVYQRVASSLRQYRLAMAPDQAGVMPGAGIPVSGTTDELLAAILSELRALRAKED